MAVARGCSGSWLVAVSVALAPIRGLWLPRRLPEELPGEAPGKFPVKLLEEFLGKLGGESPGELSEECPGEHPEEPPGDFPGEFPNMFSKESLHSFEVIENRPYSNADLCHLNGPACALEAC